MFMNLHLGPFRFATAEKKPAAKKERKKKKPRKVANGSEINTNGRGGK